MNDEAERIEGSLVRAGGRNLATVASANPLVARGFAFLAHDRSVSEAVRLAIKDGFNFFLRGMDWLAKKGKAKAVEEFSEAISRFDEAIRLNPNNADAFRYRGKTWLGAAIAVNEGHDDEEAIKDFDEVIRLDPNSPLAYVERALTLYWGSSEDFDKEIKDFDEAIRLDPNNAGWYALRGTTWFEAENYDSAISDFNEAIRLNPNSGSSISVVFYKTTEEQEALFEEYNTGNPILKRLNCAPGAGPVT